MAAEQWAQFVQDVGRAFAILQAGRAELCAVAAAPNRNPSHGLPILTKLSRPSDAGTKC